MKTMFLFFSMLFLSCFIHAQQKLTQEEARFICAEMMANFTNAVSDNYKEGMGYEEFQASLCGEWQPVEEGKAQLEKAFSIIEKKTSKDEILKTYAGVEIAGSLRFLSRLNEIGIESDGSELFGGKTESKADETGERKCKWYQVWCHVQVFANWVLQNWDQIRVILDYILHGI
jgi:hypothetical protein